MDDWQVIIPDNIVIHQTRDYTVLREKRTSNLIIRKGPLSCYIQGEDAVELEYQLDAVECLGPYWMDSMLSDYDDLLEP